MEAKFSSVACNFIVYALVDPRTDVVRYIGKTKDLGTRVYTHLKASYRRNPHKANWIALLRREGYEPRVEILEYHDTEAECFEGERWNIATYRSLGVDLTNLTNGGEGPEGMRHSLQTRAKMSQTHKARKFTKEHRDKIVRAARARRGYKYSDAIRLKMSRAHGGRAIVDQFGCSYFSIMEAARRLDLDESSIRNVLYGRYRHTAGYVFHYG